MKPTSLCLIEMGRTGLELVKSYPDVLPVDELNNIILKSIPMGSNDGDFTTSTVGPNMISGYIFAIPGEQRQNIASLVAVFNDSNYEQQVIKKVFSFTVDELRKSEAITTEIIANILPKLYDGLVKGKLQIKISQVTSLNLEISSEDGTKEKKDSFDEFGDDVWR
ncbi:MAG: hypothetical protein FK734_21600 [Asgard group archaeon]|nr:hypothetical protein [Asgard group archaeon]